MGAPGGNVADPVVRQVDIARPAVVRIITRIDGQLSVRFTSTAPAVTFPLDGSSYPIELSGSGAFISARGDILTADHVVNPPHDQALNGALYQTAAQDIADYVNAHFRLTQPLSASDVLASLESGTFQSIPAYGQLTSRVYLSTAFTGPVNATRFAEIPASDYATVDQIEAQSSFDAMDVAIVHVSGMDDMPGIQLGDSSQVAEQDTLTIIGYPGLGDVSNAPTNLLTSSINRIYVSAMKTTDSGAPVIQVGGNVEHGDSGAPALDRGGHIVGIVSFGLVDPNESGETSFLQASDSARALIQTRGINTAPGPFQRAWTQALNDYASTASGHWHKAARELRRLADTYTSFQGITSYLTYAQSQANSEHLPTAAPAPASNSGAAIVVLALLALIAIATLLLIVRRQRMYLAVATRLSRPGSASMYRYVQQPGGAPGVYLQVSQGSSPQQPGQPVGGYPTTPPGSVSPARVEHVPADVWSPLTTEGISAPASGVQSFLPLVETPVPAPENVREDSPPDQIAPVVPSTEARGFTVPRRPALPGAGGSFGSPRTDRPSDPPERVAPCGHVNQANMRFCRICGLPVTLVGLPESDDVRE